MLGGSANLNDLVEEITDLINEGDAYLRIEYIVGLVKQMSELLRSRAVHAD